MIQPHHSTYQTYKDLKLLDLTELIELENKKLGYKIHNELLPTRMLDILNSDPQNKSLNKKHRYNTQNKDVPYLPKLRAQSTKLASFIVDSRLYIKSPQKCYSQLE